MKQITVDELLVFLATQCVMCARRRYDGGVKQYAELYEAVESAMVFYSIERSNDSGSPLVGDTPATDR